MLRIQKMPPWNKQMSNFSTSQQPSSSGQFVLPTSPSHSHSAQQIAWGERQPLGCWIHAQRALFCLDLVPEPGCLRGTLVPSKRWIFVIYSAFIVVLRRTIGMLFATLSQLNMKASIIFKLCFNHENSFSLVGDMSKWTSLDSPPTTHSPLNLKRERKKILYHYISETILALYLVGEKVHIRLPFWNVDLHGMRDGSKPPASLSIWKHFRM